MTVEVQTITAGPFAGNGTANEFAFEFKIVAEDQITVFETDDEGAVTTLELDTDYTVSGVGDAEGGTVTRVAGNLPTGYTWYMRSNYDASQDTAFTSQGAFFPSLHEAAFDKLTYLILQAYDRIQRTFRFADSYSGDLSTSFPEPAPGASIRWNDTGDGLQNDLSFATYVGQARQAAEDAQAAALSMTGDGVMSGTEISAAGGGTQTKTISGSTTLTNTLTNGQAVVLNLIGATPGDVTITGIVWVGLYAETEPAWTGADWIVVWKSQDVLYGAYTGDYTPA